MKTPNKKSALLFVVLLAGCSSPNPDGIYDPLEPVNRGVFEFNHSLDRHAALPAASYYKNAVPDGTREGIHNFLSNLGIPVTFANDVLQGEFTYAGYAVCRLGVNSTVGVLGFRDPATDWGCLSRDEDFGQTLGVYGVPGGPYLVLPLIGATLPRDVAGKMLVDHYFNPMGYLQYRGKYYVGLGQNVVRLVDQRSRAVSTLREVERTSIDYYAAMRRLYVMRRNAAIHNEPTPPVTPPPVPEQPGAPQTDSQAAPMPAPITAPDSAAGPAAPAQSAATPPVTDAKPAPASNTSTATSPGAEPAPLAPAAPTK